MGCITSLHMYTLNLQKPFIESECTVNFNAHIGCQFYTSASTKKPQEAEEHCQVSVLKEQNAQKGVAATFAHAFKPLPCIGQIIMQKSCSIIAAVSVHSDQLVGTSGSC